MNPLSQLLFVLSSIAMTVADDNICCPPDKFHATMFGEVDTFFNSTSSSTELEFKYDMNVDYVGQQIALRGSSPNGGKVHFIIHPNVTYDINDDKKTCSINTNVPYTPRQCLPKAAKYIGDLRFGNLNTKAYFITSDKLNGLVAVTKDCLYVNSLIKLETKGMTVLNTLIYSKLALGADDKAFVIPSYCPKPGSN